VLDNRNLEKPINAGDGERKRSLVLSRCQVFFDFDNTITPIDVLDDVIQRFSINDDWISLEEDWLNGKIGSDVCLAAEMKNVRIAKRALLDYLGDIDLGQHFYRLLFFLKQQGATPFIVSDSFSFFIKTILANNGIRGLKIYANHLKLSEDGIIPIFPYQDDRCRQCGNCKRGHLLRHRAPGTTALYVGDGQSDICAAESANLVFAKGSLKEHFQKKDLPFVEFRDLGDVTAYLKEANSEAATK
jgi:2-hydroxy-3-keto-5-methylthiopentenyl-1-phosphate phosphatase